MTTMTIKLINPVASDLIDALSKHSGNCAVSVHSSGNGIELRYDEKGLSIVGFNDPTQPFSDPAPIACGHKWVHTDTRKPKLEASGNQHHYIRIDQFFCEKCLKTETVRRSEYAYETPDWY